MYTMKIEDGKPLIRNGTNTWRMPVLDERGTFYPSQAVAAKKLSLAQCQISQSIREKREIHGHVFKRASVKDVQEHLGREIKVYTNSAGLKTAAKLKERKAKARAKKKVKKEPVTYALKEKPEALKLGMIFEGHQFTGGPAVLCIPGQPGWRMERPSKDDFPPEMRDACRWT